MKESMDMDLRRDGSGRTDGLEGGWSVGEAWTIGEAGLPE